MKKIFKSISVLFIITLLLMQYSTSAFMYDESILSNYELNCKSAVVYNTDTDTVVFEKNADKVVSIASLTKIMTALCVLENCNDLSAEVEIKESVLLTIGNTGLVTAGLKKGEIMSVENLLHCLLIPSAADASVVLADYIGGSVDNFVEMMNKKAKDLGLKKTHFENTHGLDSDNHHSTAREMAVLTAAALKNKTFKEIVSLASYTVPATNLSGKRELQSTNLLLHENSGYFYKNALGIKTGYTGDAGRCLATLAKKGDTAFLSIVLGCDSFKDNGLISNKHFTDSIYLLEDAFSKYTYKTISKKGSEVAEIPVKCFGIEYSLSVVTDKDISYLVKNSDDIKLDLSSLPEELKKPYVKGDEVTKCKVMLNGETLDEITLVAGEDIERSFSKSVTTLMIYFLIILAVATLIFVIRSKVGKTKNKRH